MVFLPNFDLMKRVYLFLLFLISAPSYGQDLIITDVSGATSVDKYSEIKLSITVQNAGIVSTQRYATGMVYLSLDNVIDANDFTMMSFSIPTLNPGESVIINYSDNRSLTIKHFINYVQTPIETGIYNLILKADQYAQVIETDELNNIFTVAEYTVSTPDVDLQFTYLNLSSYSATAHSTIDPLFEARNSGITDLSWMVLSRFYLSTDQVLDGGDVILSNFQSNTLNGVDVFTNMTSDKIILPNVTPGTYYVIGKVDTSNGNGDFLETDELNNVIASAAITISPSNIDLTLTNISISLIDYGQITGTLTVTNEGTTEAGRYEIEAFLSTSPGFNDYAVFLSPSLTSGPTPGNSGESVIYFSFDAYSVANRSIPYTLFVRVNQYDRVTETDYTNNTISFQNIYIPEPPIHSWSTTAMSLEDVYDNTDKELGLDITILNNGTAYSLNNYYQVVIKDATNSVVHSSTQIQYLSFSPGQQQTKNWNIVLANALPVGEYTIHVSSGYGNTYSIPLSINQVQYTLTGNIQGEDGVPITKGKLFLYQEGVNELVKFIDKVVPTTSDLFSFPIDDKEHTLFFIPDRIDFPNYAPTIYGKTVTLEPTSFFALTADDNLTFEILKLSPPLAGSKTIGGSVASGTSSSSRVMSMQATSLESFPVVLLSETGEVLAVSETGPNGEYHFDNLASGKYQVIVAFELDQYIMPEPILVDVTQQSAILDFQLGEDGVNAEYQPVLEYQNIGFNVLDQKTYGDAPFQLTASSSANLLITYASSNPQVAEVHDNVVTIVGAGTTTITASQNGNSLFHPAPVEEQVLTVQKADQDIEFTELPGRKTTDSNFQLIASSTSGLAVSFSSDNERVATVDGNMITIKGAGQATITATQNGNQNYNSASVARSLNVSLESQSILFNAITDKKFGDASFKLSASSTSGLPVSYVSSNQLVATVKGDLVTIHSAGQTVISAKQEGDLMYAAASTVSQLLTVLKADQVITFVEFSNKRTTDGEFQLFASATSGLAISFSSDNDEVATINGNLVTIKGPGHANIMATQQGNQMFAAANSVSYPLIVHKTDQVITFDEFSNKKTTDTEFYLVASTTSGLTISFSSDNENVATVEGNLVSIKGPGQANITAFQAGDKDYTMASPVTRVLMVELVTALESLDERIRISPNPTSDMFSVYTSETIEEMYVSDLLGRRVNVNSISGNNVSMAEIAPGTYLLHVKLVGSEKQLIQRIVKQ